MDHLNPPLPEIDYSIRPLYDLFWDISTEFRTQGINGPDPLAPAISAWMNLMNVRLNTDTIDVLMKMDRVYRSTYAEESERRARIERENAETNRQQQEAEHRFG